MYWFINEISSYFFNFYYLSGRYSKNNFLKPSASLKAPSYLFLRNSIKICLIPVKSFTYFPRALRCYRLGFPSFSDATLAGWYLNFLKIFLSSFLRKRNLTFRTTFHQNVMRNERHTPLGKRKDHCWHSLFWEGLTILIWAAKLYFAP